MVVGGSESVHHNKDAADTIRDVEPDGAELRPHGYGALLGAACRLKGFAHEGEEELENGEAVEVRHPVPNLELNNNRRCKLGS